MRTQGPLHSFRLRQRGSALITAMVIVTLVTTLAASMVWQQWRAVQVEASERAMSQSHWILSGALDWGRLILREDARNGGPDHLGEPWAVPLAEARLSSFLSNSADSTDTNGDAPEAFLSGQMSDATARWNLYNVIKADTGDLDPVRVKTLEKLCATAGVSGSEAAAIARGLRLAWLARSSANPVMLAKVGGEEGRKAAPLAPQTVEQLVWLGVDAATAERLRPFVTLLSDDKGPVIGSPINLNTASREVMAAVLPNVDVGLADRLVQVRQRQPFKDVQQAAVVMGSSNMDMGGTEVRSDFFEIQGRLRLDNQVSDQRYLVKRANGEVVVLFETRTQGVSMPRGSPS